MNLNQVTVTVSDIPRAKSFYQALGLEMIVSSDHYARFLCSGGATFSIHKTDRVMPNETAIYFECEDLDRKVASLKAQGFVAIDGPTDKIWLWREAWLTDPDGNRLCIYWAGPNRVDPPWRVLTS